MKAILGLCGKFIPKVFIEAVNKINITIKMAHEYLAVKTELSKLRNYKAQLTEKIKQNQEMEHLATPTQEDENQFIQLKSEKVKL